MPISHYQSQKGNQKSNSLNTKLDGVNYFRIRRNQPKNLSNRSMSSDRYPPYQGDSTGLTQSKLILNHKRASQNSQNDSSSNLMQTSCSLPETPIFNRMAYCDIPRTPLRKTATDSSTSTLLNSKMAPRQSNTIATLSSINNYGTGPLNYRRGNSISGLESAAFSGELLRMTGGPARGWYPKHRNSTTRPTSVEQLDRLSSIRQSRTPFWSAASSPTNNEDKPLTLPPNLTPKCFQRSPKEALRRVTSLLIKRGTCSDVINCINKNCLFVHFNCRLLILDYYFNYSEINGIFSLIAIVCTEKDMFFLKNFFNNNRIKPIKVFIDNVLFL